MKKLKLLLIGLFMLLVLPFNINAAKKDPITVHMFRGEGCGYCKAALEFFDSIESEYGDYFDLETHEVWYDEDNASWMQDVADYFGEDVGGVPYIIIGEKTFQGYAESYDEEIIEQIKSQYDSGKFVDIVNQVKSGEAKSGNKSNNGSSTANNYSNTSKKSSNKTTIIIIIVALVGFIALIYFARDTEVEEEIVEEEVKKEEKVVSKPVAKKATPKKTAVKKTTTGKATAKKTTAKKTTTKNKSTKK